MQRFPRIMLTCVCCLALAPWASALAEDPKPPAGAPDEKAMMDMWAKMSAVGENHKLLEGMAGDWEYVVKWWMDPSAPPNESKGETKTVPMMGGRFYHSEHKGTMKMPGKDGQMEDVEFHGAGVSGYDNMKQKFVNVWMDNMSTGFFFSEGTYDAATKTFTYVGEMDDPMGSGSKVKVREVIKIIDKDHHTFEWFETRGGQESRTMEISYTRKK